MQRSLNMMGAAFGTMEINIGQMTQKIIHAALSF
jgi:hypothetical protein